MNKTDKSLDRLRKKNKDSNKQNQKSRGDIISHATVKKGLWDCYKQFYDNKLNYLEEIDKYLETYNLSRLNHEEEKTKQI